MQKLLSVGFEGLLKGFPPQLKFENEEVPNLREASQCLRSAEPPRCSPCTGYYQLRGEGRGGATFVLLKLMGPPIDPQPAARHTREEEETPWGRLHLQLHLAAASPPPSTIAPSIIAPRFTAQNIFMMGFPLLLPDATFLRVCNADSSFF